ncbi:DinB family protein [Streptomyces sp. NPDC001691]|uniref:DinB family protein n=1 Tax=Streptomyces sp. NPDC001691 TaxID=3364600 RepID=UPI00367C1829
MSTMSTRYLHLVHTVSSWTKQDQTAHQDQHSCPPRVSPTPAYVLIQRVVQHLGYRVGWYFGGKDVDSQTFAYAGTADEALKQLDEMYGRWNAGVRELSDADLDDPPTVGPERWPMENRVLHVNRELIHHGAEISLLRDLYRWQDGAVPRRI